MEPSLSPFLQLAFQLFVICTATVHCSIWPFDNHICKKFANNDSEVVLQAMTMKGSKLYIIESDLLYEIDRTNLDTGNHVLRMYDNELSRLEPVKWYKKTEFRFNSLNVNSSEKKRQLNFQASGRLKFFTYLDGIFPNPSESNKNAHGKIQSFKYYEFLNEKEPTKLPTVQYTVDGQSGNITWDSERMCWLADSGACRYSDFRTVTDGNNLSRSFMFFYNGAGKSKHNRVLMAALLDRTQYDKEFKVNYPKTKCNGFELLDPKQPRVGLFLMKTNNPGPKEREYVKFVTSSDYCAMIDKKQSQVVSQDYFVHLPFGFIIDAQVYLVSPALKRVYYFDHPNDISGKKGGPNSIDRKVSSKPWKDFFHCDPKKKVQVDVAALVEQASQEEYMDSAGKYVQPLIFDGKGLSKLAMVALVALGLFIGLAICIVLNRIRKRKLSAKRKKLEKQQTKTTLVAITSTTDYSTSEHGSSTAPSKNYYKAATAPVKPITIAPKQVKSIPKKQSDEDGIDFAESRSETAPLDSLELSSTDGPAMDSRLKVAPKKM